MVPTAPPAAPDRSRTHITSYDPDGAAKLSTVVVHALADVMDADVTQVEAALYERIDPASLDRLFARTADGTPRRDGEVTFTVQGYRVTVDSDGQIEITSPQSDSSSQSSSRSGIA